MWGRGGGRHWLWCVSGADSSILTTLIGESGTRGSSHLGFIVRNLGEIKKTVPLCVKDTKAIVGHGYVMPYKLQMIAHKLF